MQQLVQLVNVESWDCFSWVYFWRCAGLSRLNHLWDLCVTSGTLQCLQRREITCSELFHSCNLLQSFIHYLGEQKWKPWMTSLMEPVVTVSFLASRKAIGFWSILEWWINDKQFHELELNRCESKKLIGLYACQESFFSCTVMIVQRYRLLP